jgi:Zn-dependent metalloprotease
MGRSLPVIVAAVATSVAGVQAAAAAPDDDRVTSTRQISEDGSRADAAVAAAKKNAEKTKFGDKQQLIVTDALADSTGDTHVRMRRTYDKLRVVGGDLVVHRSADGSFVGSSQTLDERIAVDTEPAVSAKEAAKKAPSAKQSSEPKLVVNAIGSEPKLSWIVTTGGQQKDGTPSRLDTYVDAETGAVLRSEERIQTVDGDGDSLYGGTVPLQLTQSGSTFQLKDPTRGNTFTTDMNNRTDSALCTILGIGCQNGTLFTSPDTHFGNGTTSSRESAAVDAQYGTNVTWDFFRNRFGRNGIFGTGAGSFNRVHYGRNYVNAFWDGTKMTYGDGNGTRYGPLTSLDVAGHEMSHGVTQNTANLTYSGESGGLNEATSDIFGSMVEFHAANSEDPGDYLIGEEFDSTHAGLRRMDDPDSDGNSLNCYAPGAGNVDVHYSSGIGNHFYYLLAEGSGPKTLGGVQHISPTCNGSSVTGIGRTDAAAIWYRALTVYMTSSTNYAGARTATLNAARDLFTAGSVQQNAVAAAWSAVSVN